MAEWEIEQNTFGDEVLAWEQPSDYYFSIRFLTVMYGWNCYMARIYVGDYDHDGTQLPRNWTFGA